MTYLRLAICAISAFLVGCASYPAANSYYEAPAYVSSQPAYSSDSAVSAYEPAAVTTPVYGRVAENGSYYGQPNVNGVPKTVGVSGYTRKDGTYVRGHYRSAPGSNPPSTRRRK
jgi:hypothetical protein